MIQNTFLSVSNLLNVFLLAAAAAQSRQEPVSDFQFFLLITAILFILKL